MTTLTESPPVTSVPCDPSLLTPAQVRRSALSCIAQDTTPGDLRVHAVRACPDLEPLWHAWAAEAENLTAQGMTRPQAVRALRRTS